jgi:hypothetical protein
MGHLIATRVLMLVALGVDQSTTKGMYKMLAEKNLRKLFAKFFSLIYEITIVY